MDLIASTDRGLYCAAGDFHIDPWRPVPRAIITHAHSDHARFGSEVYVCHRDTAPILRKRLGDVAIETATYGQILTRDGVELSFHPAGHVLGSAQVRVAWKGEIWVASGDYKLESDGVSPAFEPLRCHAFVTESTFGLPIYRWRPQADTFAAIDAWRRENIAAGRASLIFAYALGKAQRVLAQVDPALGPIVCHGAVEAINALYREAGIVLPPTVLATQIEHKRDFAPALIVAPPSAAASPWLKRFGDYSDALASGWMQVRGNRRRRGLDRGFALSDHADWPGLIAAIEATGAERILVTHGYTEPLTRYLREKGLDARALTTAYGDDEDAGEAGAGGGRGVKAFAALYRRLDSGTSTRAKQAAMVEFFATAKADPTQWASAAWTVYFLSGGKPRQTAPSRLLWRLAVEGSGYPEWLCAECYGAVGDVAEMLSLLLPDGMGGEEVSLDVWMRERLLPLPSLPEEERYARLKQWVGELATDERLAFFKLITGELRVGVSRLQVVKALAEVADVDEGRMAQRLIGYSQARRIPTAADFEALIGEVSHAEAHALDAGKPYPFYLAQSWSRPLAEMLPALGPPSDWIIEWKYDGIRAQLLKRGENWRLWSRGEELISDAYPDLTPLARALPSGTAIDGELVVLVPPEHAYATDSLDGLAIFASLQQRLGRKIVSDKTQRELPVAFIAYDILESEGRDLRGEPQHVRRALLEQLVDRLFAEAKARGEHLPIRISPTVTADTWEALAEKREQARALTREGLMLKARDGAYGIGRRKGGDRADVWWKWKLDPMSVDAVVIYAERGHGRRSGVYTDYTFAVWSAGEEAGTRELVPFAKAYSGLSDKEIREMDAIVRRTTVETFGPVRSVTPTQVFELGFEGIAPSKRHKSGVAVRFPRMLRWRHDKPVAEADTLDALKALLAGKGGR